MKHPHFDFSVLRRNACAIGLTGALLALWPVLAQAAVTELANNPIANTQASKPNIMLIVDTSDSMRSTHMPDDLEVFNADAQPIGYRAHQCNPLYYDHNPLVTYTLPKVVDTTNSALPLIDAPTPSFTASRYNFYNASDLSVVDLSVAFQAFDDRTREGIGQNTTPAARSDTPQPAYYYVYTGTANLSAQNAYKTAPCTDPIGTTTTTGGSWSKVLVTSAADQAKFAIWYSYYRTRIALVKSGIGRAFGSVDDKYRVGFISAAPLVAGDPNNSNVPPASGAS